MTLSSSVWLIILALAPGLAMRAAFSSLRRGESFGEALFGIVFISALVSGWIALALAEFGRFSLAAVAVLAALFSLSVLGARRRMLSSPIPSVSLSLGGVAVLAVLAAAVWLFFRPNEYVLGGRDHGVYVNTGAAIARTGGILQRDAVLDGLTSDQRPAILEYGPLERGGRTIERTWHAGTAVPGFYLFHLDSTLVQPHGFHLYPVWFAVLNATGGTPFSLYLTPALAWLSVAAIVLVARRTFGWGVALLAAALLAVNLAQVWYARTPSAEVIAQFLFWSGLWAWLRAAQTEAPLFGLLGGLAWGQIHLAKIDYVTLPLMLAAWLAWVWWTGRYRRYHTLGMIAYLVMALHATLHSLFVAPSYFYDVFASFAPAAWAERLSALAAQASSPADLAIRLVIEYVWAVPIGIALIVAARSGLRRVRGRGAQAWTRLVSNRRVGIGTAVFVMGVSAYAYFRPAAADEASALVEMSWYFGLPALALGIIGFVRRIGRSDDAQGLTLWSVLGLSAVLLVGGSFTYPDHFWAVRRYVPLVIPGLLLLASDTVVALFPRSLDDWRQALVPLALATSMFFTEGEALMPFARFVENGGALAQVAALNDDFESGAVLLFDRDSPGALVGTPLGLLFERSVAYVDTAAAPETLPAVLETLSASDRPVYYLASANRPFAVSGFSPDYLRTVTLHWPSAEQNVAYRPVRTGEYAVAFDVYRLLPPQSVHDAVLTLDVGSEEARSSVEGVYDEPVVPALTSAQWTTDRAVLTFQADGRPRKVLLRMGNTPSSIPPLDVEVLANGMPLGIITVEPGRMRVYSMRFPDDAPMLAGVVIELRVPTWNPRALGFSADRRDLGVSLDWVKLVVKRP